jgi:hypothetical protein
VGRQRPAVSRNKYSVISDVRRAFGARPRQSRYTPKSWAKIDHVWGVTSPATMLRVHISKYLLEYSATFASICPAGHFG